jgi:hypothetical protein
MKKFNKFTYGGANQDVKLHLDLLDELTATVSAKVPITLAKALIETGKLEIPSEISAKLQSSHTKLQILCSISDGNVIASDGHHSTNNDITISLIRISKLLKFFIICSNFGLQPGSCINVVFLKSR